MKRWLIYVVFLTAMVLSVWTLWLYRVEHQRLKGLRFYSTGPILQSDSQLGYTHRPLSHAVMNAYQTRYTVQIDSHGLRIHEKNLNQNLETGGLAGVGCSMMFGHGLAVEDTLLERLGRHFKMPVYNLGVSSYSPVTSLLRLEKIFPLLRPRVVLYLYGDFHYDRAVQPAAPSWFGTRFQPFFVRSGAEGLMIQPPLLGNVQAFRISEKLYPLYIQPLERGETIPWDFTHLAWLSAFKINDLTRQVRLMLYEKTAGQKPSKEQFADEILSRLTKLTRKNGAHLIVACVSSRHGPCSEVFQTAARRFEREGSLLFLDLQEALDEPVLGERYAQLYELNPHDSHPNARFQREAAAYLIKQITSRGIISAVDKV